MGGINGMALKKGVILNGRFRVDEILGAGGFGITYKGFDLRLRIPVAIKEYFPRDLVTRSQAGSGQKRGTEVTVIGDRRQFEEGIERFVNEATTLAHFNNRNNGSIVSVIDRFEENNTGYMVMDYIPGQTLKEKVMGMDAPMSEDQILKLMIPLLEGLKLIHDENVIHRDISPDNIIVNSKGKLTLIDFGSARDISASQKGMTVIVKHGYAPSEQYNQDEEQGPWTDVYALCATMYFMVTHAVPEVARDRRVNDSVLSLEELGMPVSHRFSEAIKKGLAVQRKDRFQNVSDLKEALLKEETETAASGQAGRQMGSDRTERYQEPDLTERYQESDYTERYRDSDLTGRNGNYGYAGNYGYTDKYMDDGPSGAYGRPGPDPVPVDGRVNRGSWNGGSGNDSSNEVYENRMKILLMIVSVLLVVTIGAVGFLIWQNKDPEPVSTAAGTTKADDETAASTSSDSQAENDDAVQDTSVSSYDDEYGPATPMKGSYVTDKDPEGGFIDGMADPADYSSVKEVPEAALVKACEKRVNSWGSWIQIEYCGVKAWVKEDQLTWLSDDALYPQITEASPSFTVYVYSRSHDFKLRTSPNKDSNESNVAARGLSYGTELTVTEIQNGWGRVSYDGKTCWVELSHCRTYFGEEWRIDDGKDIKFRSKPSEESKELIDGKIPSGTSFKVKEKKDGFAKVEYKNKTGWVSLHYMTFVY